ncbi:hypothetical protein BZG02_17915 [Labilibaculum filiforme]|uniref:Uncharacterized protein n=1 Tax=Labilibaculum filiforme TaxID=1940526 RepID=A0A2N3HS39_9BACT|nr:hypothetical protein [Labilibaculum filiforme]PKQ60873.1 hypothetical protein BZG02_17915 [Labilibaculum filiforme]
MNKWANWFRKENKWKQNFFAKISLILLLLIYSVSASAISKKDRDSLLLLPLFKNDQLLKLELKADFSCLLNDVGENRDYHKCQFKLDDHDNLSGIKIEVEVMTRGNFRRQKQNCNFPPLRFKFPEKAIVGTEFEGQSKLKYVSHCQSNLGGFEQNTIKEYLIYKMYNLIEAHSYRVRLSQILFIDSITKDSIKRYGFFLEDRNDVAARNGKSVLHYKNIKQYNMLRTNIVKLSLFQLMIGNSDWNVERLHNIDILSVDENSIPMAVPFDFDWSGIINQAYFTLDPAIAPDAKYKRKYKGFRWSDKDLELAFSDFYELKEPFLNLILECKYLNKESKLDVSEYILKFYDLIASPKDVKKYILKNSPKIPTGG